MWDFLRHFLTPHHTNNHRPKALHSQILLFYIVFLLILQLSFSNLRHFAPNILGLATDINVEQLLALTNEKRTQQGLSPLNLDSKLSQAAAGKARDMFNKDYWAHNSPDGLTPWVFIKDAGYSYLYAGENLAKNFNDSSGVVNAWMDSPSHKANLLKAEYQDIGFAVVNGRLNGEETTLVVQMFGVKQSAAIASRSTSSQPIITPVPAFATPVPTSEVTPPVAIPGRSAVAVAGSTPPPTNFISSTNRPLFDAFALTKASSLGLLVFLLSILSLDALLIWRRKTIRLVGHNFAHFFFLLMVAGAVLLSYPGAIR